MTLTPEQRAAGTQTAFADLIERLGTDVVEPEGFHRRPKSRVELLQERAEALQALRTLAAENERKTEALGKCAAQFALYAVQHERAGKHERAATNDRYARLAEAAISGEKNSAGK